MGMSVEEARAAKVCRICGEPIRVQGPIGWPTRFREMIHPARVTLNFGAEFAHSDCLEAEASGVPGVNLEIGGA